MRSATPLCYWVTHARCTFGHIRVKAVSAFMPLLRFSLRRIVLVSMPWVCQHKGYNMLFVDGHALHVKPQFVFGKSNDTSFMRWNRDHSTLGK
jgi:prepilin-type processing-associated H-X9-DG protein